MGTPPPPYEVEPHPHAYAASPSGSSAPAPAPIPRRPVAPPSILDSKAPFAASAPAPAPGPSGLWLGSDPRSSSTQSLLPEDAYAPSASLSASSAADAAGRRTLLVIYLHGFLGNDQSFRSFPAHVHALLTNMLVDSHVIHSKIYPRYKTYRAVDVARDNFSTWLAPHESPTTDVILVGHSMGGILAADIILMPNYSPYGQQSLKHRILGHVSLDCPFLGLHPGIIVSGISSLFKPAPQPQDPGPDNSSTYHLEALNDHGASIGGPGSSSMNLTPSQSPRPGYPSSVASSSFSGPSASGPADQFFNQPFFNDAAFREQPFVRRMLHFASKYRSEGLIQAAAKHVVSYLEFGGCLADQAGLESRYCRLRALEDVDELKPFGPGRDPRGPTTRVRFVNYYTLCTGRPKTPKPGTPDPESHDGAEVDAETDGSSKPESLSNGTPAYEKSSFGLASSSLLQAAQDEEHQRKTSMDGSRPSITIEDHDRKDQAPETSRPNDATDTDAVSLCSDMDDMHFVEPSPMEEVDPTPMSDEPTPTHELAPSHEAARSESRNSTARDSLTMRTQASTDQDFELDLAPIPDEPVRPALPDLDLYGDKDARKQAEREAKRLQRAYDQAVKDRAKAIREREKIIDKRRKKAQKAAEKLEKDALKEAERLEKKALKDVEREETHADKEKRRLEQEALRMEAERQRMQQQPAGQSTPSPASTPTPSSTSTPTPAPTTDRTTAASSSFSTASSSASAAAAAPEAKPRKLRRFCNLPDAVPTAGGGTARDPTWVDIFMTDVDEVGAHCGLFMAGPHYERLVGDVGSRIVGWVQEDMTRRAILEMGEVQ
ncbi:hypothetical protein AK830_g11666 [Neonectria ditissima]|uniref:DUF676 domain-containing protein n=1 Tax=Neonectria ditissima TaxID=78410 RepID=A0A0P7ALQ1_9HYPO|nr:hypothetical protein AK830_g11666 [Neonectria ditissima]